MNAHFCALVPNLRIMEIDPDVVPWYDEMVTNPPEIKDGHLILLAPRLGAEVNEAAVRAHPPRKR
jgi:L-alanine-DL-glutamate epimerase-like enolase superfamily enzyme